MRWNQGRSAVDRLIADGELQRVPANREHADQLLGQARKDLASAEVLLDANLRDRRLVAVRGVERPVPQRE